MRLKWEWFSICSKSTLSITQNESFVKFIPMIQSSLCLSFGSMAQPDNIKRIMAEQNGGRTYRG